MDAKRGLFDDTSCYCCLYLPVRAHRQCTRGSGWFQCSRVASSLQVIDHGSLQESMYFVLFYHFLS